MAEDDSSSYPLWSMVSVVIVRASQLLLGLTTVTLLGLYYKQDSLLYFPSIGNMPKKPAHNPRGHRSPAEYQMAFEDIQIVCEDKVKIHAWLIFGEEKTGDSSVSTPTLVFFHGNAGNIGFRLPNAVQMVRRLGVNVCLVEYRGYGNSDAVAPNEKGLKRDGVAALKFLQDHPKVNAGNIFLFGRSLGGAVAFATAQYIQNNNQNHNIQPLRGVIVENTFTSIPAMVDALMPLVAKFKRLILSIAFDSLAIVSDLTCPVLYLAGNNDEIVPHSQMLTLHRATVNTPMNRLHVINRGTHNESWSQGGQVYWDAVESFIAGALSITNNDDRSTRTTFSSETAQTTTANFKKEL